MKLYRMHKRNNIYKGIWRDAPPDLEFELSSPYGVCGAEGMEEDDYFAVPLLEMIASEDFQVLAKYGYVVSCIEVSAWGEVYHNDAVIECLFKFSDVISVEEVDLSVLAK
jgi:hypothetical protein